MALLAAVVLLAAAYPLWQAGRGNQQTTLRQALLWAGAAWAAWVGVLLAEASGANVDLRTLRYLALCLLGCAGVAVLGARRPGVGAWNFVVLGLLAVCLLPLAEGLGRLRLGWPHLGFLVCTLAVGILNYLPTRFGPAALLLAVGGAVAVVNVLPREEVPLAWRQALPAGQVLLALVPWLAYVLEVSGARPTAEFDRLWLTFRDRFGFVWAQRVREQFNRAADHAGWPVVLRWRGLRVVAGAERPSAVMQEEIVATLRALLKRFAPTD